MRTLIVTEFMSLDGVVDSPGGEAGYRHAGWTFDVEGDPAMYAFKGQEQEEAGAILMGRVSYEAFAPVWPTMEYFAGYNAMPKYVVSTTLAEVDPGWSDTTILRSLDDVRALKEGEGGPILVHGSATLAQGLLAAGLVDLLTLLVFPVVLGSGKRLFPVDAQEKVKLALEDSTTYSNGVQLQVYRTV
jgi:dihydrofolate reductase